jgi:hypothetical protein
MQGSSFPWRHLQQVGGDRSQPRSKWPWVEDGPSTGSPPQSCLTLILLDIWGMSVMPMLTKTTHLFGVLIGPTVLAGRQGAMGVMAGASSSGPEGAEPPSRKAHPCSFLWVSPQYAWSCPPFMPLQFSSLKSKTQFLGGRSHTSLTPIICRPVNPWTCP